MARSTSARPRAVSPVTMNIAPRKAWASPFSGQVRSTRSATSRKSAPLKNCTLAKARLACRLSPSISMALRAASRGRSSGATSAGSRIAITETIGEQQRQTGPSFRALGLANGGELEARERLALPSTGEHSSIVVVLELAVIRSEGVSRECSHSLELRIENRSVGLGDRRDPARDASLVGRQAQRIPRLVVGSAPNLRAGIGADETSRDSHSAVPSLGRYRSTHKRHRWVPGRTRRRPPSPRRRCPARRAATRSPP